jgi:serine phosphatase RsbU (regulator of sigma subunit)
LILFDAEYLDETIELKKGDKLLLFSDGFFEAFNEDNKILGFSEFIKWIEALAEKPLTTIIETLIKKTLQYSNSVVYDDMTMFGFQYE